jgi:hypothetical protein
MNVHFGSLRVSAAAARDYTAAVKYLSRDPLEADLFNRLEHGAQPFRLVTNARDNDSYDPGTHTIHWDPHSALRTTCGTTQSPALGLGHEVDHAVHDAACGNALASRPDPNFDTLEERRVITGSERHAARTLGEGVRHDHAGTSYRVPSPTAMPVALVG